MGVVNSIEQEEENINYKENNDWICEECKELNFSYRTKCRKCNWNNYKTNYCKQSRAGDWFCKCGYHNFDGNKKCLKCDASEYNNKLSRKGDWNCNCGYLNFQKNDNCRKCSKVKTD